MGNKVDHEIDTVVAHTETLDHNTKQVTCPENEEPNVTSKVTINPMDGAADQLKVDNKSANNIAESLTSGLEEASRFEDPRTANYRSFEDNLKMITKRHVDESAGCICIDKSRPENNANTAYKRRIWEGASLEDEMMTSRRRKLEFEEQRIKEERTRLLMKEKQKTIREIIKQNKKEMDQARERLMRRYSKRTVPSKKIPTAAESIKSEVRRIKESLVRFIDSKIGELLAEDKESEEESAKPATSDAEIQTDMEQNKDDVNNNPETHSVKVVIPTSTPAETKSPQPAPLFGNITTMASNPNNPFLNPAMTKPIKPLFGATLETAPKEPQKINLFSQTPPL